MSYNTHVPIVSNGIVFYVDSYNHKSYGGYISYQSTTTGSSYSGFALNRVSDNTQQPIVIDVPGNVQAAWLGYISLSGGMLSINLSGGAIPEVYNVNNAYYDNSYPSYNDVTVLYPNLSAGSVTMSHTCSIGSLYNYYPPSVKIPGDFTKIFNLYLANTTPLILSLTGGGGPIISGSSSGASYSGFALNRVSDNTQQPIVIDVPGNVKPAWDSYISSSGGTLPVYLSGGATAEIYNVNKSYYDSNNNVTVLYPNFTASSVTMSHTCSNGSLYNYYPSIKISGIDLTGIFNIYLANTSPLILSLTGGGGPIISGSSSGASYSGFALDKTAVSIPGNVKSTWDSYISLNSGTVSVSLSGGAIPEIYDINRSYYDQYKNSTVLYPNFGSATASMTQSCSIVSGYFVVIPGIDLTGIFSIYLNNTSPLILNLSGGAIPESINITSNFLSGIDTYLYGVPPAFSDHTQFEVVVPDITGTLYTDNTIFTYSYFYYPESYAIYYSAFDGTDTYLIDYSIGPTYNGHTEFKVIVPKMIGTQYIDNTIFTYSYFYYPESYAINSVNFDGIDTYVGDLSIGVTYSGHTEFKVVVPEMIGTQYTDNTSLSFSYLMGTTSIDDMTLNNNIGVLNNGVSFDGKNLTLDGVDDYIDFGVVNLTTGTDITIDMVINLGINTTDAYADIMDYNHTGGGFVIQQNGYSPGSYYFAWCDYYPNFSFAFFALPLSQYIHLCITKNSTNVYVYADGILISTGSGTSVLNASGLQMRVGSSPAYSRHINATINNFKIYNRSLSVDEVQQNYNALKNRYM